jgi:hypothetical protein
MKGGIWTNMQVSRWIELSFAGGELEYEYLDVLTTSI